jgi:hypothetical protein
MKTNRGVALVGGEWSASRPGREHGVWRIKSNLELQNAYKSQDIVTEIKTRRFKWLRHVIKMDNTRIPSLNRKAGMELEDPS